MKLHVVSLAALLGASAVGCAGSQYPAATTTPARAEISAAEALGAERVPSAQLHLKLAKDQVATAERLIQDGENDDAYLVLQRAEADARLSRDLTRDAALRAEADRAVRQVEVLRRTAR